MLPFRVISPVVVTVRYSRAVVVPTAPSVTAPEPEVITRYSVFAVVPFTALEPKLTTPLFVDVVMVTSAFNCNVLQPLKFTPVAVPVVILP
jgi:hypothetical protein